MATTSGAGGAGAGLIGPEVAGMPRRNAKIDRATTALRADKASGPFANRESGAIASRLFAGVNIDAMPAVPAPGAQQQTRFSRGAERRWPRGAFVAFPLTVCRSPRPPLSPLRQRQLAAAN